MPQKYTPYRTPEGFFKQQQEAIWKRASSAPTEPELKHAGRLGRYAWAAGLAATLTIGLFFVLPQTPEACETFACLWDRTPVQSIPLDDAEIETWMDDDLLFETVLNETTDA